MNRTINPTHFRIAIALIWLCCVANTNAEETSSYSPALQDTYPVNVYWGDTHLHTNLSGDAPFRRGPDVAYRFARGETVTSNSGQPARLTRPLDFLVVADHGNNMGAQATRDRFDADPAFAETPLGRLWAEARDELLETPGVNVSIGRINPMPPGLSMRYSELFGSEEQGVTGLGSETSAELTKKWAVHGEIPETGRVRAAPRGKRR